ncbi:hypothetical protein IF1G_00814 [Cordyceps javanica]|uniref:Secreted protein n=1 Tax=Cordyceps javanica TaxID=43265 RepID=A0A545VGP0_9HYPO|nr:hypothetical protein IF1G_00814 [Cordyceps javanica]
MILLFLLSINKAFGVASTCLGIGSSSHFGKTAKPTYQYLQVLPGGAGAKLNFGLPSAMSRFIPFCHLPVSSDGLQPDTGYLDQGCESIL